MAALKVHKFVSELPGSLEADSIYFVKVASAVSVYVTNATGNIVAYPLVAGGGGSSGGLILSDTIAIDDEAVNETLNTGTGYFLVDTQQIAVATGASSYSLAYDGVAYSGASGLTHGQVMKRNLLGF